MNPKSATSVRVSINPIHDGYNYVITTDRRHTDRALLDWLQARLGANYARFDRTGCNIRVGVPRLLAGYVREIARSVINDFYDSASRTATAA